MVDLRYMNFSTTSRVWSPIEILGVMLTSWLIISVFFKLIVRPNSLHAAANLSMSLCSEIALRYSMLVYEYCCSIWDLVPGVSKTAVYQLVVRLNTVV